MKESTPHLIHLPKGVRLLKKNLAEFSSIDMCREKSVASCQHKLESDKKRLINTESTGQKLSGAFCSYPHLGHGLGQRHFRGFTCT